DSAGPMKKRVAKKKKSVQKKRPAPAAKAAETAKSAAPAPVKPKEALTEADRQASKQREISVSEFFLKNRHLLGFDNAKKALLTTIKEAVDNSLDACEEARILPEVHVQVKQLEEDRFLVVVEDNGPGVVREQIPKIFGKL